MSASKLEKNMANLERRMRKEFLLELDAKLEPCLYLFQTRSSQECREGRNARRFGPSEGLGRASVHYVHVSVVSLVKYDPVLACLGSAA